MRWCAVAGLEPMMAVNLGTRGVAEALDLLEYCNIPGGTATSDLRRANGAQEPYGIRVWCLGNEMDGPWQIGHKTATEYGRLAAETARAMRMVDGSLELVACGSSARDMPTFGEWEATVLRETYDVVDHISAHAYYQEKNGDLASFLASPMDMDAFVDAVAATADAVRAALGATKRITISFDEWNVWYMGDTPTAPQTDTWPVAPRLLEDHYSVADAVVVGGLLISLLRHSDRVHAASLAQLVNVIAPIMTEPDGGVWCQTTFHPFALTARHAVGKVLGGVLRSPAHVTERFGDTPLLDAVATFDEPSGAITVLAVNRSPADPLMLVADLRAFGPVRVLEAVTLADPDPHAKASPDDAKAPRVNGSATVADGGVRMELPPASWSMLRLARG